MSMKQATYSRRNAEAARRSILDSRNQFWRPTDLDAPPSTVQRILADLVTRGELRHIRKGPLLARDQDSARDGSAVA
jgi:hypothetical protein